MDVMVVLVLAVFLPLSIVSLIKISGQVGVANPDHLGHATSMISQTISLLSLATSSGITYWTGKPNRGGSESVEMHLGSRNLNSGNYPLPLTLTMRSY